MAHEMSRGNGNELTRRRVIYHEWNNSYEIYVWYYLESNWPMKLYNSSISKTWPFKSAGNSGTTKYSYDTSVFTVSWSVADTIRILSPLPVGREWLKLPFVKWGSIAGVGLKSSSPACSKSIDYSCHVSSFLPAAHCQCQLPSSGRSLALNHIATSCLGGKLRARRRISPLNVFSMLAAVSPSLLNYYVCGGSCNTLSRRNRRSVCPPAYRVFESRKG